MPCVAPRPAGSVVAVSAAGLGNLVYVGGQTAGTETIELRASGQEQQAFEVVIYEGDAPHGVAVF